MLPELSLHILDIAENALRAGASSVGIDILADIAEDLLTIVITDDGCGMDEETLHQVADPFYTTRTTRKIGLGVPFFKQAAELSGGQLSILSDKGSGTKVTATFVLSSIDRMPLGDVASTMHILITTHEETDFSFLLTVRDDAGGKYVFEMHTEEMRTLLEEVPFHTPEVSAYIREYLTEHIKDVLQHTGKDTI